MRGGGVIGDYSIMREALEIVFYKIADGREPVRDWLKTMGRPDSTLIGESIGYIQRRWPVALPTCRALKDGLYEARSDLPGNRAARVFFGFHAGRIVLLHGIIKKSQKTPEKEMVLARRRLAAITG